MNKYKAIFILVITLLYSFVKAQSEWISFSDESDKLSSKPQISLLSSTDTEVIINIKISGMLSNDIQIDNETYQQLFIPDGGKNREIGNPELPTVGKFIEIPYGVKSKISVINYEFKVLEGYNIYPVQEEQMDSGNQPIKFVKNNRTYSTDTFYPEQIAILDQPHMLRGHRIVLIHQYPVQYNPISKKLRVYSEITVRIEFEGTSEIFVRKKDLFFQPLMEKMILNYEYTSKDIGLSKITAFDEGGADYLIITPDDFYNDILPLAEWKQRKGLKVRIAKKTDIINAGYTWTADNTFDATFSGIDGYIKYAYDNWDPAPSFVLLVGDADSLPTHYIYDDVFSSGKVASDLYYGCMDDSNDPLSDLPFPDIFIGRFSVLGQQNDINTIVAKIIEYEMNPDMISDNWFYTILLAALEQPYRYYLETLEEIRTRLVQLDIGLEFDTVYTGGSHIGTTTDIIDAINRGCFIANHRDHGAKQGWSQPSFTVTNVNDDLSNGGYLPVMFSINCSSGRFDDIGTDDCLGEAWLKKSGGGGVGFIGSTRGSPTYANNALNKGLYDAIWSDWDTNYNGGHGYSPSYYLGQIMDYGKIWVYDKYSSTSSYTKQLFNEYIVIGDPSLEIWTEIPSQFADVDIMDDGEIVYVNVVGEGGCDITASSGDNGASFHEVAHNVQGTGFETPVRPLYITVTKHNFTPYTAVTGGTFTSNETWFGNFYVLGDVFVSSGITLTINPGTTIKFDSGKKLTVNGTLDAQGTSANHIVFTSNSSTPSAGDWYGIRFENSSVDDECIIKNCEIEYASYGIYCSGANPSIENNTILNNHKGIFLGASSPSIKSNIINENNFGILGEFSNPHINNNKIINNYYDGVCLEYASFPKFYNNTITNNGCGTYFNYHCDPRFGPSSGSGKGYNIIANNRNGIIAVYNSYPFLGSTGPYNQRVGGYNSIYSNNIYNAYADIGTHIEAEYNWWDNQFYKIGYGGGSSVDYIPYLSSDPGGGSSLGKGTFIAGDNFNDDEYGDFNPKKPNINRLSDLWLWANELWLTDQLHEAINVYRILIRKFSETSEARHALVKVLHLYEETEMEGLSSYLNSLINSKNMDPELKQIAFDLLVGAYLRDVDINKAIHTCDKILHKYPDTESEKLALFHLVFIYNSNLEDMETAQIYLQIMKDKYPYDKLTLIACDEMGEEVDWSLAKRGYTLPPEEDKPEIPEKFALSDNYPNPFNPITTIAFDLPEVADVILTIYDITGRKIVTLINDHFNTGYHKVMWNGRNEAGNLVSSGIYLYHIHTSTGFNGTKKMVLVR